MVKPRIILASSSPRRQALLRQIGLQFDVISSNADETVNEPLPPADLVRVLAQRKAEAIHVDGPAIIIGADTVVSAGSQILGKPKDADDACRMLRLLQGTRHTVYTGVCLIRQGASPSVQAFVDHTDVYIRPLTAGEILEYVQTGEPFDKAGAYGAQGMGCTLISRVDGDYNTVVGLPLVRVYLALRDLAQGDAAA